MTESKVIGKKGRKPVTTKGKYRSGLLFTVVRGQNKINIKKKYRFNVLKYCTEEKA